jgi:hypothetical protein
MILTALGGCDKFEGGQEVPAYLDIREIQFTADNQTQGTDKQNITDAWVYVDDQLVGGFEIPAVFPVLASGPHKVEIRAGIKLNGISDTRAPYPLAKPIILEGFDFEVDSILPVSGLETEYLSNVEFHWMEDFEDQNLSLKANSGSDTNIYRTSPPGSPDAFVDEYSLFSGLAVLEGQRSYLLIESDDGNGEGFVLDKGDFIFLEVHCKTGIPLLVGMAIRYTSGEIERRPYIYLNSSEDWNKVYINFTPVVNESAGAENFKIYFEAAQGDGASATRIMLDNIKLLSRPNL